MPSNHPFLVAAACALPLSIAACGSDSGGTITPEGTHYGYVVSKASVPATTAQETEFGLDLGSKTSADLDGTVDNALGHLLSIIQTTFKLDIQSTINAAVDQGSIILLIDFQTKDFTNASASGFSVKIGANPTPAACNGAGDTVCRHHLDGTAAFEIAPGSPTDALVAGKIASGTFNGGPGDITLQIALGTTTPIQLNLLHARVRASTISATGIMTANVAGLVTQTELTTQIGPAIQASVASILTRDCTGGAPPGCGCTGTGATVLTFLDTNKDCAVTTDEIFANPVVSGLLQPDSCSTDSCKTPDSLSIGVQVQAVKATFPM